jgi:hypothetical protein
MWKWEYWFTFNQSTKEQSYIWMICCWWNENGEREVELSFIICFLQLIQPNFRFFNSRNDNRICSLSYNNENSFSTKSYVGMSFLTSLIFSLSSNLSDSRNRIIYHNIFIQWEF